MGILQCVADEDAVLIRLEDGLALQDDTAYTVGRRRHQAGVELTDVLMPLRAEVVALILVEAQVELSSVLYHRAVERRQQDMVLVVKLGDRYNQQTVVLTRVTVDKRRRTVGTTAVRAEQLAAKAFLKIRHHGFLKSQITHGCFKVFLVYVFWLLDCI